MHETCSQTAADLPVIGSKNGTKCPIGQRSNKNDKNIKNFDVVLSSRVRISRNIASAKFPNILTKQEKLNVTNKIKESIKDDDFRLIYMSNLTKNEIFSFVEKNLISKEFANKEDGALIVNSDFSL